MKRRLFSCFLVMALLGGGSAMAANIVPVTPAPLSYEQAKGTFSWKNGANVCFSGTKDETDVVKTAFSYSAFPVNYVSQPADGEKNIRLELDKTAAMPDEGYRLEVTSDEVKLKAKTSAGLFYGIQTLVQLAEAGHGKVRACRYHYWNEFRRKQCSFPRDVARLPGISGDTVVIYRFIIESGDRGALCTVSLSEFAT